MTLCALCGKDRHGGAMAEVDGLIQFVCGGCDRDASVAMRPNWRPNPGRRGRA